ncbi:MAG TPA: DUF4142 domain-containing protein [Tepidisphaeraceae bacterium]|jgi:predicted outer membrane protein
MKRGLTWGILGLTSVMALNQTAPGADRDKPEKLDHQEVAFLNERAQDDVMMWKLGEYAAEHAATDRVKHLGKAIIEERRTDLRDIQKIAQDHNEDIKIPDSLNVKQKYRFDQLTRQAGQSFDRDYTKDLVRDYDAAIPQLKRERDQAGHVDVREYAGRNVKMFEDHLKETHDAEKEVWK